MKHHFLPLSLNRVARGSAIAVLCLLGAAACTAPDSPEEAATPEVEPAAPEITLPVEDVVFADVESPVGGLVKQLTLPGPQTAVMVMCDQEGFVPFAYNDGGWDWVGCQVSVPGTPTAGPSTLTEPVIGEVESPVGGTVFEVTIPGPESAVSVVCEGDFVPSLYEDQGTWVGCQAP